MATDFLNKIKLMGTRCKTACNFWLKSDFQGDFLGPKTVKSTLVNEVCNMTTKIYFPH